MKQKLKYISYFLFILVLFLSCSKNADTTDPTSQSTVFLKFKLNGVPYVFNGPLVISSSEASGSAIVIQFKTTAGNNQVVYPGDYSLKGGYDNSDEQNYINIGFLTVQDGVNQLNTGTYSKDNFKCDCYLGGKAYFPGVNCVVNINSITNNKYSGTFTATMKDGSNSFNTVTLTDGTFENLPFIP